MTNVHVNSSTPRSCRATCNAKQNAPVDLILRFGSVSSQYHVQGAVAREQGRRDSLHPRHPRAQIFQGSSVAGSHLYTARCKLVAAEPNRTDLGEQHTQGD